MKIIRYVHQVVTQGDWSVSYTTGHGINGAILNLHRSRVHGKNLPVSKWMHGNGDQRLFPSTEAATQWAFDHGYLQLYFTHPDLRARRKARAYNWWTRSGRERKVGALVLRALFGRLQRRRRY